MRASLLLLLGACGAAAPPEPIFNRAEVGTCVRSEVPEDRRFALGTTPDYNMSSTYGNGPPCWVELVPSPVVELRGDMPVLVDEGAFHGVCGGSPMPDSFESVRVSTISVRQTLGHRGLARGELDSAHPEWQAGFRVFAADSCGENLRIGRRPNGRWSDEGCERVLRIVGARFPRDEVTVVALGKGTCQVEVEFLGATTRFAVNVR
ncbi:MAG: hypothetical protein SFX73_06640 [Kofleriaceae bacterium]|nr:hypothetical protein [Kofleriaceae bacterium]